jgi:hypothetical protein
VISPFSREARPEHYDWLTPAQSTILPHLAPLRSLGAVLYGGTAVSLYFAHRGSRDFDFFTSRPVSRSQIQALIPQVRQGKYSSPDDDTHRFFLPLDGETVQIALFGRMRLSPLSPRQVTEDGYLTVASVADLAVTKIKALYERVEARDYHDIAVILESGYPLEEILIAAHSQYGPSFHIRHAIRMLTHFSESGLESLNPEIKAVLTSAVDNLDMQKKGNEN